MATASSRVAAGVLVLVLLVLGAAEAQVPPIPCCRWNCCDGKPECCEPSGPPGDPAAAAASPVAVPRPAAGGGSASAGRKVAAAGN
ncbi:hypothetical protein ACP4OV_006368 [Aristida adscensionis]